jgi:ferrous iron transport protein A
MLNIKTAASMLINSAPLTSVQLGQKVEIVRLPKHTGLQSRLLSMGIKPGTNIQIIRRGTPGNILHLSDGIIEFMLREDQAKEIEIKSIQG